MKKWKGRRRDRFALCGTPWPKEHETFQDLINAVAGDGGVLIAFYGDGEFCTYQKVADDDETEDSEEY